MKSEKPNRRNNSDLQRQTKSVKNEIHDQKLKEQYKTRHPEREKMPVKLEKKVGKCKLLQNTEHEFRCL